MPHICSRKVREAASGPEDVAQKINGMDVAMDRYGAIKSGLLALAEPEYAKFAAGLLRKPTETQPTGTAAHMLGIRLPKLRKLAGKLAKENWRENLEALAAGEGCCFEEVMLQGFLVGKAKIRKSAETKGTGADQEEMPGAGKSVRRLPKKNSVQEEISLEEQFTLIGDFVSRIDNWSLCDSFCAGLKFAAEYQEETWAYLQRFLWSEEEYAVRFGVVMLLNYFINETYIGRLFDVFRAVGHDGYYVKMAVAWAVSICYVKFPERTEAYLEHSGLDDFTFQKALQKIAESRCVSEEVRRRMRERRREQCNCR